MKKERREKNFFNKDKTLAVHTLPLPSHWPTGSLIAFYWKPTLGQCGFEKSSRTHARPNLRSGRISCRDTHARQISPATRDPAFSNPDPTDRPFSNPDQAGNSPLSPPFPYFVLTDRIYWSGFHWAGRGRGWPVCWISGGVWIQPE